MATKSIPLKLLDFFLHFSRADISTTRENPCEAFKVKRFHFTQP